MEKDYNPEGWYCPSCDHFHGEEGSAAQACDVCGNQGLEYHEDRNIGHNYD